jgi:DNA polymerase III alpha subunit
METDLYGQVSISPQEAFECIYSKKNLNFDNVYIDDNSTIEKFNLAVKINADPMDLLQSLPNPTISVEQFDTNLQDNWFMPEGYKSTSFDIVTWLLDKCTTEIEKNRVLEELQLFAQHDMIELLCYLRYLVDIMQQNNIIWGVGRGSSVSSYILFLIGVHRINSIKYDLDIQEFLK